MIFHISPSRKDPPELPAEGLHYHFYRLHSHHFPSKKSLREPQRNPSLQRSQGSSMRSEEHTSELQSRGHLVCRLLLEKKKKEQLLDHTNKDRTSMIAEHRYKT